MLPVETLARFDRFLVTRSLHLTATVIGGSALSLLGVTTRATRDCDVLDPELPDEILVAAGVFAEMERGEGRHLDDGWLNNGPRDLARILPAGWKDRQVVIREGKALTLRTLGRSDLLVTKLFALCDRATDLADCIALAPTPDELRAAEAWVSEQDANPDWPAHVSEVFADMERRVTDGI